jgi:heptosyltransferase II
MIKAKKILVRAPNWVGDIVMATPAFRCGFGKLTALSLSKGIRENFADSHITLLVKRNLIKR